MLKYNPGRGRRNGIKTIPTAAGVSTLQATRRVPEGHSLISPFYLLHFFFSYVFLRVRPWPKLVDMITKTLYKNSCGCIVLVENFFYLC